MAAAAAAAAAAAPLSSFRFSHRHHHIYHLGAAAAPAAAPRRRRSRERTQEGRHPNLFCCLSLDRTDETLTGPVIERSSGDDLRIVFAAGGTGGRIYPAIAIADELRNADPEICILFIGSEAGMEKEAVPSAGYDFVAIPAVRLARTFISPLNLLLPFHLLKSVYDGWKQLCDFRPQIVVGSGGYVSVPVCLAAALMGIKLVIQEQNSSPGTANWVLAPFASKIYLAFNSCVNFFPKHKCVVSGNPVRLSLRRFVSKAVARLHFFPRAGSKTGDEKSQVVLILGGSSGSNAMNVAVLNMYYQMLSEHKERFIIWQTGEDGFTEMECLVKNHRRLLLTPFLHTMDLAYAAADVVVSRAGAMTCTEILTTGKPSILVPSPNVAEDLQTKNAYIMADIAGSKVLTEDELDSSTLEIAIDEVLGDEQLRAEMSEKAMKAARPDASTEIAQSILSLVKLPLKSKTS